MDGPTANEAQSADESTGGVWAGHALPVWGFYMQICTTFWHFLASFV